MDVDLSPPGPLANGGLRVTALGGISEIGRNMTVFEHLGRLLIIDCGVMFPTHDEPGVDLILPDLRHIEDRLEDIEALVLTHAHEDHIGGIPFLLKLRPDIPVVGSKFTLALVAAKCREHRIKPVFVEVAEERIVPGWLVAVIDFKLRDADRFDQRCHLRQPFPVGCHCLARVGECEAIGRVFGRRTQGDELLRLDHLDG